jgi:hypothetical protein
MFGFRYAGSSTSGGSAFVAQNNDCTVTLDPPGTVGDATASALPRANDLRVVAQAILA